MKKTILTIFTLLSCVAFADVGHFGSSAVLDGAGNIKSGSIEKFWINCKNTSGGALLNGDVVILDVTNDDGYSCTTSTTAGDRPLCVYDEACASNAMCKCQTYGLKTDVNFDVTNMAATAGLQAYISEDNAGFIEAEVSPAATDYPIGTFYDSASASGDVELFIRLR